MTALTHTEYLALLQEVSSTLEKLTEVAQLKTAAVRMDDLATLNECMKQEQALSLALRGFEQKRTASLPALGLVGVPLSTLSSHYPLDHQMEAKAVSESALRHYRLYQSAAEVARNTLESNLHQVESFLAGAGVEAPPSFTYSGDGYAAPPQALRTDFRA